MGCVGQNPWTSILIAPASCFSRLVLLLDFSFLRFFLSLSCQCKQRILWIGQVAVNHMHIAHGVEYMLVNAIKGYHLQLGRSVAHAALHNHAVRARWWSGSKGNPMRSLTYSQEGAGAHAAMQPSLSHLPSPSWNSHAQQQRLGRLLQGASGPEFH